MKKLRQFYGVMFCLMLLIMTFSIVSYQAATTATREYKLTVVRCDAKLLDDVADGVEIEVMCDRKDLSTGKSGAGRIAWYAEKGEFPHWPPTKVEFGEYVKSYLEKKAKNKANLTRLMEAADEPTISHQPMGFQGMAIVFGEKQF